jgi:hypothetical protein
MASSEIVTELRRQIAAINRFQFSSQGRGIDIAIPELADLFPQGQLPPGSVVEWFTEGFGTEAERLSLRIGWAACRHERFLVIVDPLREIYPPALFQLAIDLKRVVFVHPSTKSDVFWSINQALRCSAVGAVWSYLESLDPVNHRRCQLASECSGTLGIFVRPLNARKEPSWADFQLLVQAVGLPMGENASQRRQIRITLLRAPGLWEPITREVWIDDPTDRLPDFHQGETPAFSRTLRGTGTSGVFASSSRG